MNAYQTTLSKTTGKLSAAHFTHLNGLTINGINLNEIPINGPVSQNTWQKHFPFSPVQFFDFLGHGYNRKISIDVDLAKHQQATIKFYLEKRGYLGEIVFLTGDQPNAYSSSINLPEDIRGQNIGKNYMRNLIEFNLAMGSPALYFSAGYDNGGYSWASMGADIDLDPFYATALTEARLKLEGRLCAISPHINHSQQARLKQLIRLHSKDDLAVLARDFRHVMILPDLAPDMMDLTGHEFTGKFYDYYKRELDGSGKLAPTVFEEVRNVGRAFQWAVQQGQEQLSLPRFMLTRVVWPAVVDYSNADIMQSIGNYLGGWRTIATSVSQTSQTAPAYC